LNRIGILTSGGDAPGMNGVIRAVVRTAVAAGVSVMGIRRGYEGLLTSDIVELGPRSVSDILQRGGTMLLTARCKEMTTPAGQERAAAICKALKLDGLIVGGGDGSFRGAKAISEHGVNVIGVPCTIDLDLPASDYTIGFDTAVTTAVDAIGKIRDTASAHERVSVVEVMGRRAGHIALWCAIAGGAEEVMIPETPEIDKDAVLRQILENRGKGRKHNLIIVAEGVGNSVELAAEIEKITGIESRATILGHLQRGGSPTVRDRMHSSMMGYEAVKTLLAGRKNRAIVYRNGGYIDIDIDESLEGQSKLPTRLYEMLKTLSS
jgi:6-phosphofructokinase 1